MATGVDVVADVVVVLPEAVVVPVEADVVVPQAAQRAVLRLSSYVAIDLPLHSEANC